MPQPKLLGNLRKKSAHTPFPSVVDVFQAAFDLFIHRAGVLLGISAFSYLVTLFLSILYAGVFVYFFRQESFDPLSVKPWWNDPALASKPFLTTYVFLPMFLILQSIFTCIKILAASDESEKLSFVQLLKTGFYRGLGAIGVAVLAWLLIIAGLFFLLIPGIVLMNLFSFVLHERILARSSVMTSLRTSANLVRRHFWQILFHWIFLFFFWGAFSVFLRMLTFDVGVLKLFSFFVNGVLSIFFQIYGVTLYKAAKKLG